MQNLSKVYSYISMSLIPFRDLKFLRLLLRIDVKYAPKEAATVRNMLNNEMIRFQPSNPFLLHPFPPLTNEQIPATLLLMFKNMEETSTRNLNLSFLESFVSVNLDSLKSLLIKESFYCQLFCQALIRYLQEYAKTKQLAHHVDKIRLTPFIDLFTAVLEIRKEQKILKPLNNKDKESNATTHTAFLALLFVASVKYVKQADQRELLEEKYLQKAVRAAIPIIEECEREQEFEVVREYISIVSHQLIFNGLATRPLKMLDFCLENDKGLYFDIERPQVVPPGLVDRYIRSLYLYIQLDPQYHLALLKLIRNLLVLNIANPMLYLHFEVVLELIRNRTFGDLKKQVFDLLLESQNKHNIAAIDQIFLRILNSGVDLMDDDLQSFNLMLAQSGQTKRKEQFAIVYYHHYNKSPKRMHSQLINFIFQAYLDLNLPLEKLQLAVGKQANIINSSNMNKLHEIVGQKRKNSYHFQLLSIIIQKRKETTFRANNKKTSHQFITEDWLAALGNYPAIYEEYLTGVLQMLCERSLEIMPVLINIKSCVLKIKREYWSRSLEFYSVLLKSAEKYDVYEENVFRYMLLLQAVFGEHLPIASYSYFTKHFCKITNPETSFLTFLEYMVRMLRNRSAMLLYLQAVLEFNLHLKQRFYEEKIYDIFFLASLVEEEYFGLATYSFESAVLLYQLSLFVKNDKFQEDYLRIMRRWSGIMSRYQCKNLQYLFSFREITSVYGLIKEQEMKEPLDRIKMLWETILKLIDAKQPRCSYIAMQGNKITVDWKEDEQVKRGLKISGTFLRSTSIELHWSVWIETREKNYIILINYDRAIIEEESKHLKQSRSVIRECNIKELKKRVPESIDFALRVQCQNKKTYVHLRVYDVDVADHTFDGCIMQLRIHCKDKAFLKNFKLVQAFLPGDAVSLSQHIIPFNRWEIRTLFLNTITTQSFGEKFDFEHALCCIGEMLRNFPFFNLPFAYDIFLRLATKMFSFHEEALSSPMQVLMQIFDLIDKNYENIKGRGKPLNPYVEVQSVNKYPKSYYYLFVSALLPKNFWSTFSESAKKDVMQIVLELQKHLEFREIQNKRLLFFDQLLEISKDQESYFAVCEDVLDNHELSNILNKKFSKLLHLAMQFTNYKRLLTLYLEKNVQYLNIENEEYFQKRLRSKFLIINSEKQQEELFKLCSIESKISILHYHTQNPSFNPNGEPTGLYFIKKLIEYVDLTERGELIPWLLTEVKQIIFKTKLSKCQEKTRNYYVNFVYLQLLLMNRHAGSKEDLCSVDEFIFEFLQYFQSKIQSNLSNKTTKAELQAIFHSQSFLQFLQKIISEVMAKYHDINVNTNRSESEEMESKLVAIFELSLKIITNFEKKNFIEFMIKYRFHCSHNCQLLKALIQHDAFKSLSLANFSIFLQYIFEILIIIEHQSNLTFEECHELIISINQYFEFLINSLEIKSRISKALFYNYPRLASSREGLSDSVRVLKKMKRMAEGVKFLELRGGIYFKSILIVIKLMKLNPNSNYNNLIEYFLFGPQNSFNKEPQIFKAPTKIPELVSTSTLTIRQRSVAELYTAEAAEMFKLYYNEADYPQKGFNEDVDLSIYIADFFLMSIAEFLQEDGFKVEGDLFQKYSNSFLRGISNQKILKQMLTVNSSSNGYEITKYEDVILLFQEERMRSYKEKDGPTSPIRQVRRVESAAFEDVRAFVQPQIGSPRRRVPRKKTEDLTHQPKKRAEIIDTIKSDCKNWSKNMGTRKISTYFCDKAKEIKIMELMHTHFVLKNSLLAQVPAANPKDNQQHERRMKDYLAHLRYDKKELSGECKSLLEEKNRKVKKIFPYTSEQPPVLNIVSNCLPNMTCPITLKITKSDYDIRRHNESICMRYYLNSPQPEEEEPSYNAHDKFITHTEIEDSVVIEEAQDEEEAAEYKDRPFCELVTREGSYFCEYSFEESLTLVSRKDRRAIESSIWYLRLGTHCQSLINSSIRVEILPQDVVEIFYRRFNQTTNNSLEFFLKDGTSKFVTFYRRQSLSSLTKSLEKTFRGVKIIKDVSKQFEDLKYSERWAEGVLSNFDYLMLINKYAGRTYNDLNQYYVFPWVLQFDSTPKIDLTNPNSYRDLSKPIGALNPGKMRRAIQKYRNESNSTERCFYGSHYSTSLFVFYYLVRLEPYSSLHRDMQKGNWDAADRLFSSIQQVWDSLMSESSQTDIKECIPEFYYMPAFLRNIANIELGKKQCGSAVGDVELPPWAKDAEQFVVTMRAALESDHVSENLHLWIDLIFGKHQCSEEKMNIFLPCTYSDPEILSKFNSRYTKDIEAKICQIYYFGQCPIQLFKKEHKPKKLVMNEIRIARSTYRIRSESNIPMPVIGQGYLLPGWAITDISAENAEFTIELKNVAKQEKQAVVIPANAQLDVLRESLVELKDVRSTESKPANEARVIINQLNEFWIGKEFLMDLDVRCSFSKTELNELWIACYGCRGIRILNWQLQAKWSWEGEQVREVQLEATRLLFSTPTGKLYAYSFLDRKLQEIVVFKDVCDMLTKVIALPRLPGRDKNQISYKVLCIGDGQRVAIANVSFEQTSNFTSLCRPAIP